MTIRRLTLPALCAMLALTTAACRGSSTQNAVVVLVVTVAGSPAPISALDVTITGPAGASSNSYQRSDGLPITFPTTLAAELPPAATGVVSIDVTAQGTGGAAVATGEVGATSVSAGSRPTLYVKLTCGGGACTTQGTGANTDGGTNAPSPRCGNGLIDPGETCDVAIAPGDPGACPPESCDDGVACTTDSATFAVSGNPCTLLCTHVLITAVVPGDGCCPAGANKATDIDCSATCGNGVVDPGETCDTAIAPDHPGACPTPSACTVADPCAVTLLVSAGTCQAICVQHQVSVQRSGDGCCPPGATSAVDSDCPQRCGDGVRQSSETCDLGISPPASGSCPVSCDDGDACTRDFLSGIDCSATCVHAPITAPISGDGCCPTGATRATDSDCPATCGDGIVEPGETCDSAASGVGACPTTCAPAPSSCLRTTLAGTAAACTATCASTPITTCGGQSDGCCPAGCTAATDPDCSATCGDGKVQSNESCDTAIAAPSPGACPTGCDDGDPCTTDLLLSAGTCAAACVHLPVTAFVAGDGCCPAGGNLTIDPDCAATCGNGVVERPVETCDDAATGTCPATCQTAGACTTMTLRGSPDTCSAACVATPIAACIGGDGCCPVGCTAATDSDCPVVCGDGVVEAGEACDRAITAGLPGACARTCDDADACTTDIASGSTVDCTRGCTHVPIVACLSGDGCCPTGCAPATDSDCAATCGDGKIEAGETCDPQTSCPTTCPDDGDPCTVEQLVGDRARCDVRCLHTPITQCSGATSDRCCPTGCTSATDSDC